MRGWQWCLLSGIPSLVLLGRPLFQSVVLPHTNCLRQRPSFPLFHSQAINYPSQPILSFINSTWSGSLHHYCYWITFRLPSSFVSTAQTASNCSCCLEVCSSLTHSLQRPFFPALYPTAVGTLCGSLKENMLSHLQTQHVLLPLPEIPSASLTSGYLLATLQNSAHRGSSRKSSINPSNLSQGPSYALPWHPMHPLVALSLCKATTAFLTISPLDSWV